MKNIMLTLSSLLLGCAFFFAACDKKEEIDSVAQRVSIPYIAISYLQDVYIYAQGSTSIYTDIPNVVAVAVDSVYGFEGGYGGKTGMDSIKLLKSEILGFGDTTKLGGSSYSFQKYSKGNYRVTQSAAVVIAGANNNPGPTALEGNYLRAATGYLMAVSKVANGVYLITNPGGAASVASNPYLLYNYRSSLGQDSLSFANQTDNCGGGLQLVSPAAPNGLTSADYSALHPPIISNPSPLTFQWRIYEFPTASATATHPGAALCNWGLGVRTFVKQ